MSEACPDEFVAFAEALTELAAGIVRPLFRTALAVSTKADLTPVTDADREAEAAMRARLAEVFPGHGVIGEELGSLRAEAEYVWLFDPIDGTKSFVTGKPLFGTLVALARRGRPILGVIDQPILNDRWVGAAGRATVHNRAPVRTRPCAKLAEAALAATTPDMFLGADAARFARLKAACRFATFGADCYAYGLLASGFLDLVAEATMKPHDYAALAPVVAGAGGAISDWEGRPLTLASDGRVLAAGDPRLHAQALRLLAEG
ncbi:MAG: histidinol-phosphatase [Proteobacteria bacterium]|nr:histidinol-phosphatase [Pseudomonadota bacterium]